MAPDRPKRLSCEVAWSAQGPGVAACRAGAVSVPSVMMASTRRKDNIMDLDLGLKCPECGGKLTAKLADVANGRTVRCSRGHAVKLKDEGGGARKADRSTRDFDKAVRDSGGK